MSAPLAEVTGLSLTVTVLGTPAPQGSKKGFARGGKVSMVESSAKVRPWREAVKWACHEAGNQQPGRPSEHRASWLGAGAQAKPLIVELVFTLPKPVSAPKRRRTWPSKRPDLDKIIRSTLDAITESGVIRDDAQVVEITAAKRYPGEGPHALASPGAWIRITEVTGAEEPWNALEPSGGPGRPGGTWDTRETGFVAQAAQERAGSGTGDIGERP